MILGGHEIKSRVTNGSIVINPFDENCLGPNSYDVHLGDRLVVYGHSQVSDGRTMLDPDDLPELTEVELVSRKDAYAKWGRKIESKLPNDHLRTVWLLEPNVLYLGHTTEYTETNDAVPMVEGRSSIGRLGVSVHATAGFGDVGFKGNWTLELSVVQPVILKPGTRIAQIFYHTICGRYTPYNGRYLGDTTAVPSRLRRRKTT